MQSHLKCLTVILLTTSMILCISGESVETCEVNSGNCIHGQCINGVCVCETCWTGENCGERLSRKPTFIQRQFKFEKKLSDIIDGGVIGRLPLSDENSSIATCGNVHFEIVSNASQLPLQIDSKSGILYSNNLLEKTQIYRTVEFNVTIREDNNHLGVLDEAIVRVSIYDSHSDEEVERRVSRVKRAVITAPTVGSIKFYRSNTKKDASYCLYDTWFVDLDITLPPGNHNPIINVYGPAITGSYRGYITYLFSNFSGVNVVNNSTMQFTDLTYIGGRSLPSRFTMLLGPTTILSSPSTNLSDFTFKIRFTVGLFSDMAAPSIGTNLIFNLDAILDTNISVALPLVVSEICPQQNDAVKFIKCPQEVAFGGVYEYSVEFFISRPISDYVFTFSAFSRTTSIGHMFITIPDTFATYPEIYEMNTEQTSFNSYFHTSLSSISVKNLQSLGLYDTSLSISNRSVRLTAYIQISTRSLPTERFEARIEPTGMNVTTGICESAGYRYSNYVNVSQCSMVVGDIEFMDQLEMVKYFNVQLIMPYLTSGFFTLNSLSITSTYAEIYHVEYLYVDKDNSNAIRNQLSICLNKTT
ncbi:unnamed protein product [Trichobilharzia szidati]|nr:unnamed protein product [Trichobilharzia szidati]